VYRKRQPPAEWRDKGDERAAVRDARAHELAHLLLNDTSPLALRPSNDAVILALCKASLDASESMVAGGTTDKDNKAWQRWVLYCAEMDTPAFRSDITANAGLSVLGGHREAILLTGFLLRCAATVPGKGGKGLCKPQTAYDQVLAIKRIHKRMGAPLEVLPTVRNALKALIKEYVSVNGIAELLPKRKEPLTTEIVTKILALPSGTKIGARSLSWLDPYFVVFKAILCAGLSAGFRKAEMCMAEGASFDYTTISRANLTWKIQGVPMASPTTAQLLTLADGDFCAIMPAACKNDPFGLHFSWKPIWLPVNGAPTNAARAIADMLIAVPVATAVAATTPLFSVTSTGEPVRHRAADSSLRNLLNAALPGQRTTQWSMHSLRIGAASALLAAGATPDQIMAMCRWRSAGSVGIYARFGPEDYGRWVLRAQAAHVDAVTALNTPRVDHDDLFTLLNETATHKNLRGYMVRSSFVHLFSFLPVPPDQGDAQEPARLHGEELVRPPV
jgi:hypothetical protein